jgi:hypothetical protein
MLRSGGHVCGAATDSLIGVYSGDAPPQQLINFILRIPTGYEPGVTLCIVSASFCPPSTYLLHFSNLTSP